MSTFELLYGQKPLLPALARLGADAHIGRQRAPTPEALAHRTNLTTSQLVALVQTRRAEQQHASATRIRTAAPTAQLTVGDVVSIANVDSSQTKFAGLRRWPGPLIIVARAPWSQQGEYDAFQLQRPDGSHISMYVPARFLRRWRGDPFQPSPVAVNAEPGARGWSGILDRSTLDLQHLGRSTHADAHSTSPDDSLLDRIRTDEERFVERINLARTTIERRREQQDNQQQDSDNVQQRADELRQRHIDTRFAGDITDFNTQIAIDNFINHNVRLSTSSRGLKIYQTIPSQYSASTILHQIRLDHQQYYIVRLNDNSNIIVIPAALTNNFRQQFDNSRRQQRHRRG